MTLAELDYKKTTDYTTTIRVNEEKSEYTGERSKTNKSVHSKLLKRIPLDRLMDLKIDYAFKQMFGSEKNKEITIVFLNAILQKAGRNRIKDIALSNTESAGEHRTDKQSRLDLLVITNANERVNIEIQFTDRYEMIKRSIYYWSSVYRSQMKPKIGYKELNPVIAINLLNFNIFDQTERFHTIYHLHEDIEKFKLTDVMEFHFIEMPKLIQDWKADKLNPWEDILARWLLLLGMVDHRNGKIYDDIFKELEEIAMRDETLSAAFENWERLSASPEEMEAYEVRLKHILDEAAAVREAELREQEALQKGEEIGVKRGKKIGHQDEKAIIARRLLNAGIDIEKIVEVTELDMERVLEIQGERQN